MNLERFTDKLRRREARTTDREPDAAEPSAVVSSPNVPDDESARSDLLAGWAPHLRMVLDAFLLVIFAGMIWQSRDWPNLVKVIPMTVGTIGALLSGVQLMSDAISVVRPPPRGVVRQPREELLLEDVDDEGDDITLRDMGVSLAAMLMFLGLIVLSGFALGGAIASVIFLKGFRHQRLLPTITVAVSLYLVVTFAFERALQVSLPVGMLFS